MESEKMWGGLMNRVKPYLAMISMQFGYAGMYIITMVSLKHGMNHYILAVYRHAIATVVIAPFALFHERYIYNSFCLICELTDRKFYTKAL